MLAWLCKLIVVLAFVLTSSAAHAEENVADRTTARALAAEGYRALQNKQYEIAVDRFRRADALVHAPTLVVDWARALVGLGQLVEAQEKYELVIREGVPKDSPGPWKRALKDAQAELEPIKSRVSWVTITVNGPANPSVTIDGSAVPMAALGVPRAVNPGRRTIRAEAEGFEADEQTVELDEGQKQEIEFELAAVPDELDRTPRANTAKAPVLDKAREQRRRTRRILTYTAFGISGAGLVVGSVFGVLALDKRSELQDACGSEICDPSQQPNIDAYHTLGTVSGIGLSVGLAGAAAGAVLLLTDPDRHEDTRATPRVRIVPTIGLGTIGARGQF